MQFGTWAVDHVPGIDRGVKLDYFELSGLLVNSYLGGASALMPVCRGSALAGIWIKSPFVHALAIAKFAALFEIAHCFYQCASHHVRRAARSRACIVGDSIRVWDGEMYAA